MNTGQACKIATYKGATLRLLVWKGLFNPFKIVELGRKVHRAKRKAQGASKKKPLLNRPGQFLLKISLWPSLRIEYPVPFYSATSGRPKKAPNREGVDNRG